MTTTTREDAQRVLTDTQAFYRRNVRDSWVFDYLFSRKLADAIAAGKLGYAPKGRDTTLRHLIERGHSQDAIVAAGVARQTDNGLVDVMRDRLTFPVLGTTGDVSAFLGRAAPGSTAPKYMNTPATDLYAKRETLYGLTEEAARLGRGIPAALVEGPLDRWALHHAAGRIRPVAAVAPCGTAVTPAQLQSLAAASKSPIILLADGDQPGRASILKTWDTAREAIPGHPVLAALLPAGSDPADLVASGRYRELDDALRGAQPAAYVALDAALGRTPATNPVHAAEIARSCATRDMPALPHGAAAGYVQHVSDRLRLSHPDTTALILGGITGSPASPQAPPGRATAHARTAAHRTIQRTGSGVSLGI